MQEFEARGFPDKGTGRETLMSRLEAFKAGDVPWAEGRVFAYVYDPGPEGREIVHDAFDLFLTENGLDPTAFPSALQLERDIIGMALDLLNGPPGATGNFTSGGTESIMLSVKAARDYARENGPKIGRPELVLPETAHAAFFKACHYFDIEPVVTPVDSETYRARPDAMAEAVGPNTILLVASAPSYAHGVVDPIETIGKIAAERELLFHVDACMGGMYLPFVEPGLPPFDFRVPGVTQMSMDFHKWGYAAKGASSILYRSPEVRRHQIFAWSGWTGYSVVNPTILSTRGAGPMAAAWAILRFFGREGYGRIVGDCQAASRRIRAAIDRLPQLYCLGRSDCNLFSFASDALNVFSLADDMRAKGWYIQPQFGYGASPANVHLSVGHGNLAHVDAFIADLEAAVAETGDGQPVPGHGAAPADLAGLPEEELFTKVQEIAGTSGASLPERIDEINSLLNGLPHAVRDRLLAEFVNRLYMPDS